MWGRTERIYGFKEKYVLCWHLYERKTGYAYGQPDLPYYTAFDHLSEEKRFGPVANTRGLFLILPKSTFNSRINGTSDDVRMWESSKDIEGSLVLRGNLEDPELELIGQKSAWTRHEEKKRIFKTDFIKKRVI